MNEAPLLALGRDPFASLNDPAERSPNPAFERALRLALRRIGRGARLIVVAGEPGTGKTLLLRAIERALDGKGAVRRVERGDALAAALAGPPAILLVDEGDRVDPATMTRVARGEWSKPVVIACARHCEDALARAVRPRVVELVAMTIAETRAYLVARLARASRTGLFAPDALDAAAAAARGNAREAARIAGAALFHARAEGADTVEAEHVADAAAGRRALRGDVATVPMAMAGPGLWPRMAPWAAAGVALSLGVLVALPWRAPVVSAPSAPTAVASSAVAPSRGGGADAGRLEVASTPAVAMPSAPSQPVEVASVEAYPPAAFDAGLSAPAPVTVPEALAPEAATRLAPVRPQLRSPEQMVALTPPAPQTRPAVAVAVPPPAVVVAFAEPPSVAAPVELAAEDGLIEVTAARQDVRSAREAALLARDALQTMRLARSGG